MGRTETCSGLSTRAFAICSMSSFIDPPNLFCALVCRRGMFVGPCPMIPLLKCSHLLLPQPSILGSMPFQQIRRAVPAFFATYYLRGVRGAALESVSAGCRRTFLRLSFCASLLLRRFFSPGFRKKECFFTSLRMPSC